MKSNIKYSGIIKMFGQQNWKILTVISITDSTA